MAVTNQEREVAKSVAQMAMIRGWETAIYSKARELGISPVSIAQTLNKVADYNDKADPGGRIHELDDWTVEKRERSNRASGFSTRTSH
jgi:hypothetical protein